MRCAIIEAETREEVMKEMSDKMRLMQERHARRLRQEVSLQNIAVAAIYSLCSTRWSKAKSNRMRRLTFSTNQGCSVVLKSHEHKCWDGDK